MASSDTPNDRSNPTPSSMGSVAFRELIGEAQRGDDDARNELVSSLYSYLLLVADQELDGQLRAKIGVSDLVQSALVHAEQNLPQFRGDSQKTLLAWARKILRNEIHSARRKYLGAEKRDTRREIPVAEGSRLGPTIADDHPSPRAEAILQEEALVLRDALESLSDDYRQVVMHRNWERLSFEEIGRRIGRSPDAARKLWVRAIRQLQQELSSDAKQESS